MTSGTVAPLIFEKYYFDFYKLNSGADTDCEMNQKIVGMVGNRTPHLQLSWLLHVIILLEVKFHIKDIIRQYCPTIFRVAVKDFMRSRNLPVMHEFKRNNDDVVAYIDGCKWLENWEKMVRNYEWVPLSDSPIEAPKK